MTQLNAFNLDSAKRIARVVRHVEPAINAPLPGPPQTPPIDEPLWAEVTEIGAGAEEGLHTIKLLQMAAGSSLQDHAGGFEARYSAREINGSVAPVGSVVRVQFAGYESVTTTGGFNPGTTVEPRYFFEANKTPQLVEIVQNQEDRVLVRHVNPQESPRHLTDFWAAKDWSLRHDANEYRNVFNLSTVDADSATVTLTDGTVERWELRPWGRFDPGRKVLVQHVGPVTGLASFVQHMVISPAHWADTTGNGGSAAI